MRGRFNHRCLRGLGMALCVSMGVLVCVSAAGVRVLSPAIAQASAGEASGEWEESFQAGLQAINEARFVDAIDRLQQAIRGNPNAREPYVAIRAAYGLLGRDLAQVTLDSELFNKAIAAAAGDRYDLAEQVLEGWLHSHFANPVPHGMLAIVHEKKGNLADAAKEREIGRGLLRALLSTGDGRTSATGFLVQSFSEEALIVEQVLGCRSVRQEPMPRNLHKLLLSCGGDERVVFFDFSALDFGPDSTQRQDVYRRSCNVCR